VTLSALWRSAVSKPLSRRTPAEVVARLHAATMSVLAVPDVRERLREQGAEVVGSKPAQLAAYLATEIPKWAALATQAGIKAE
jgi:tripartite-type tricarboxylate transporter receptor subunit TctC